MRENYITAFLLKICSRRRRDHRSHRITAKKNASDSDKPPAPHKSNRAAKFTLKNSRGEFGLFCYAHTAVLSIEGIAHPADGSGCRDPPYQSF